MRLAVTSDLHLDFSGHLTRPARIEQLREEILACKPDALVLAGDLAAGFAAFEACLAVFEGLPFPVGVVAGNHDLWRDTALGLSTEALWSGKLQAAVERQGLVWLEARSLQLGAVAVVGSMCWYDYSAIDPACAVSRDTLEQLKRSLNADARKMDWRRRDPDFAAELERGLLQRLDACAADEATTAIAVVSHVPLLEEQMTRKGADPGWGTSNAYFGNLTTGRAVLERAKVRAVISGHSHVGRRATVAREGAGPVEALVVPSDYGAPKFVQLEL